MVTKQRNLIISLIFVGALYTTVEAAITGWTNPQSANGVATPTIPEGTAPGSTGVTIVAVTDAEGITSYVIESQPTAGKLTIAASGLLSLAAGNNFDFETEPTYVLTIVATDVVGAKGTATVTLSITDVSEAPVFASAQYAATVPDASYGGATVTKVTATDPDSDTLTYSITGGNTNTDFAIDGPTGAITVAAGKTLDTGTLAGYTLTITATDAGGLTDTTDVWIAVTDCSGAGVVVASLLSLFVAVSVVLY